MNRFFLGHALGMKLFNYILAIIYPPDLGGIYLSLKIVQFNRIVPNEGCGKIFTGDFRGKGEFSAFKISAISLWPITGTHSKYEDGQADGHVFNHAAK